MTGQSSHSNVPALRKVLPQLLASIPPEWKGTTFKNLELLGREKFSERLTGLLVSKANSGATISETDLVAVGNAEDYLRVSSNISCTLEIYLAAEQGISVAQVFTWSSSRMGFIAPVLVAKGAVVHVYLGSQKAPLSAREQLFLKSLGGHILFHSGEPRSHPDGVVLSLNPSHKGKVDGVVANEALFIFNTTKIPPADILVIRKRMASPVTTPVALHRLQQLAGLAPAPILAPPESAVTELNAHMQALCGTPRNPAANPVFFAAGLDALASLYFALIESGGVDLLICSTAYGGSNQLSDILASKSPLFNKHTFDIQGDADIVGSICKELNTLQTTARHPTTVLLIEIPTNPDMKVPDLDAVVRGLEQYRAFSKKNVFLVVDTTFAPGSTVLHQIRQVDPSLPALVFVSLSKSVSRGFTCAGSIVANHTPEASALLLGVLEQAKAFDILATNDQLQVLCDNHEGTEQRNQQAYEVAAGAAACLQEAVRKHCQVDMFMRFPTPVQAARGFTSPTFSFNLPPLKGVSNEVNEGLAQRFVDLLVLHEQFKPCVSFGQDNGLVYCTVPATSTQGAIKAEDKAKQAVGGVQLVRLSFPASGDRAGIYRVLADSVAAIYAKSKL